MWVLNEITLKKYAESLKKIVGAVWELPGENGLDWLCYLAGISQTAPTIFFKLSVQIFIIILLKTHKPQLPSDFRPIINQL